jgi:hypothetical protein
MTLAVASEDVSRSTFDRSACACESCKLARFGTASPWNPEGAKLRNAVVHQYSYKPRDWSLKSIPNDPHSYYLGVELETDNFTTDSNGGYTRSRVSNEVAADMRRPKTLWVPKRDSSVSGPEFVSMPATLSYWQRQRSKLDDMFRMLLHAGYRSHDNDRCGMHINISRSAFDDSAHLFRFLTLLHASPAWALRMSQRTKESAARWASLNDLRLSADRQAIATAIMPREHTDYWSGRTTTVYPYTDNRYCALNAPHGEPRFEFRLPRGTLRIDRFFKNLEWTVGMVEYTRTPTVVAKPAPFMTWVEENRRAYPDLFGFLTEKRMLVAAR